MRFLWYFWVDKDERPLKLQVHHWGTGREEGLVRGLEVERFSGAMI
jgi:hypothetical protein